MPPMLGIKIYFMCGVCAFTAYTNESFNRNLFCCPILCSLNAFSFIIHYAGYTLNARCTI